MNITHENGQLSEICRYYFHRRKQLSSLASNLKTREIMLPILFYPLIVPMVIAVVRMTGQVWDGKSLGTMMNWVGLTLAFDIIFIGVSILTIDHILEE